MATRDRPSHQNTDICLVFQISN